MPSFDIVSRTDLPEVDNALQSARREIDTRYDFKGCKCSIERTDQRDLVYSFFGFDSIVRVSASSMVSP